MDTEFIEDGKTIDLISIGVVAEDGREYYAESAEADIDQASPWVLENVIPNLHACDVNHSRVCQSGKACPVKSRSLISTDIMAFCWPATYGQPEFWGYYADYDWVVLCQLFGTMMQLPKDWPMYCRDIKQLCDDLGNPKLPEQGKGEHHALADARWNKQVWEFLRPRPEEMERAKIDLDRLNRGYASVDDVMKEFEHA